MPFREAIRDGIMWYRDGQMQPQDTYLSYYDCTVTVEDMRSLKNDWLTDNIIAFWQEYLEHEYIATHKDCNVVLMRPSMVLLMSSFRNQDVTHLIDGPLANLKNATHIFLPVNDNEDYTRPEGGTHWSLMIVGLQDRVAFHYDSLNSCNVHTAKVIHRVLERMLRVELAFTDLVDTPQQDNGSDCGVHVCWAMRYLLTKRLLVAERRKSISMNLGGRHCNATKIRKEIYGIAEQLRKMARERSTSPGGKSTEPPRIGSEIGAH
ncbi:hypothetical protein BZA77DRAFT_299050 [Pyronema omphalodes]|nr:hypothetical protein BZA77DRAFT_299050 [Pyronema omphalodes]